MTAGHIIAFLFGLAALLALTVYAGSDAVVHALAAIGIAGLVLLALIHLPVGALMGWAWWQIGKDLPEAGLWSFVWARFVRDAAAEALPFSQLGGFAAGVRVLGLGGVGYVGAALSMSIDLILELWAKIPYFVAGLVALVATVPGVRLSAAIPIALASTIAAVALPVMFRRRLRGLIEASAQALMKRWPGIGAPDDVTRFFDRTLAHPRRLLGAFAVHLVCWALGAAETWVVLLLMGFRVGALEAVAIDSLANGLRTFAFLIPAAAGIQEASYVLVCALFGISPATAMAISLARRARDLALALPTLAAWQYLETLLRPRDGYIR